MLTLKFSVKHYLIIQTNKNIPILIQAKIGQKRHKIVLTCHFPWKTKLRTYISWQNAKAEAKINEKLKTKSMIVLKIYLETKQYNAFELIPIYASNHTNVYWVNWRRLTFVLCNIAISIESNKLIGLLEVWSQFNSTKA